MRGDEGDWRGLGRLILLGIEVCRMLILCMRSRRSA